jgi:DNA repair photolyase
MNNNKRIPLISQHSSWISLDPIQGCPFSCSYCYLKPLGLAPKRSKVISSNPKKIYSQLINYRFFNKQVFTSAPLIAHAPIAIGNYTDMCMNERNRGFLISLLVQHKKVIPHIPVCILTKSILDKKFLEVLNNLNIKICIFISISFLPNEFENDIPSPDKLLENFKLVSEFQNIKSIHWWRPFTSISVKDYSYGEKQIEQLIKYRASCSVIIGLAYGEKLKNEFLNDRNPFSRFFIDKCKQYSKTHMILEANILKKILDIAKKKSYTILKSTSCAISLQLGHPCYNARFRKMHYFKNCLASTCPSFQKKMCYKIGSSYKIPSRSLLDELAKFLNIDRKVIKFNKSLDAILIDSVLDHEQQSFLTQSASFPILAKKINPFLEWMDDWRNLWPS